MPESHARRPVPAAAGVRIGWTELPGSVRSGIEGRLGSLVMTAASQPSGFSPGAARRLQLMDGGRAFVKAVGREPNPQSPALHREEARMLAQLPRTAPVPGLLGVHDDGDWVALVLEDVEGRHPELAWQIGELTRITAALEDHQAQLTPCPVADLPTVEERHQEVFNGWRRLLQEPLPGLDPWALRHLGPLAEMESQWPEASSGDTLLHSELRTDHLLFSPSGSVLFLDWPGACRGADWFDPLVMGPSVTMQGGPDPEWLVRHQAGAQQADPQGITTVVLARAGYFAHRSLLPAPPGLPTLRPFQAAQGRVAIQWAAVRTG